MKKFFKFSLILFGVIIFLVLLLVFLLYDGSNITNKEVIENNRQALQVIDNTLYKGTYDSKSSKKAKILFKEEDLEAFIYPIVMCLNDETLPIEFTGADIDVKNEKYYIEISIDAYDLFKSVITAQLEFTLTDDSLAIKMNNAKLGKINFTSIGKSFLKNIDETQIENILEDKGIYLDLNLNDLSVLMTFDNIKNTIVHSIKDGNRDLVLLLFDVFISDDDLMQLILGENDLIGAILNLDVAEYKGNEDLQLNYQYDFSGCKLLTETLLKNNIIDYSQVSIVYNFLVRGYKKLSDEEKQKIDTIDLSSISITKKEDYKGIINRSEATLNNYFLSIFENKSILECAAILTNGITISDQFLTSVLQTFEFIGMSYAFSDYDNNVGYFTIEQVNLICEDQFIDLILVVDINGIQIYLEASFNCLDSNSKGLKINGEIDKISIGQYELKEFQKDELLDYLNFMFTDLSWISVSKENKTLQLDFSNAMATVITSNSNISSLLSNSIHSITDTYVEEGLIKIKFVLGI